jgi:hypothetical protein
MGIGKLNAFKAIMHLGYLYMKMLGPTKVILVFENQEGVRRAERNWTIERRTLHNIDETRDKLSTKRNQKSRRRPHLWITKESSHFL